MVLRLVRGFSSSGDSEFPIILIIASCLASRGLRREGVDGMASIFVLSILVQESKPTLSGVLFRRLPKIPLYIHKIHVLPTQANIQNCLLLVLSDGLKMVRRGELIGVSEALDNS